MGNNFNLHIQTLRASLSVQVVRFAPVLAFHTNIIVLSHFGEIVLPVIIIVTSVVHQSLPE
ncbi:TPA: hypothetical protein DCZ36_02485 [Candidatus Gracilibacteria bacterium]|nr:hypothetical protein [Candidatus Gracilibacteria bacterium]